MINIIVKRLPADNQGPTISNILISTEPVAIVNGTAEIDQNFSDRVTITGSMPLHTYIEPGTILLVTDLQLGQFPAMVISFSCTIETTEEGILAVTNIVVEREK